MSTNYYVQISEPCKYCGRGGELKHIGKSSFNWCFALHVYPDEDINNLDDWKKVLKDNQQAIEDEHGRKIEYDDMMNWITSRSNLIREDWSSLPLGYSSWDEFHSVNSSEQGPFGLLRQKIDHVFCVGHGRGTYDYCIGDFS